MEVTMTEPSPNRSASGLSVMTRPVTVQFGIGTMKPFHEAWLLEPRDVRLRGREDHVEALGVERISVLDGDRENVRGRLVLAPPAPGAGLRIEERLAESPASRALRRGEARDRKPGMILEGNHELLARDTRGADDADAKIAAHDVTSKAVGDTAPNRPSRRPPARREE